jgi:hypothetical protein
MAEGGPGGGQAATAVGGYMEEISAWQARQDVDSVMSVLSVF